MCVRACVCMYACGSQTTKCGIQISPQTMEVLGTELSWSGLMAGASLSHLTDPKSSFRMRGISIIPVIYLVKIFPYRVFTLYDSLLLIILFFLNGNSYVDSELDVMFRKISTTFEFIDIHISFLFNLCVLLFKSFILNGIYLDRNSKI